MLAEYYYANVNRIDLYYTHTRTEVGSSQNLRASTIWKQEGFLRSCCSFRCTPYIVNFSFKQKCEGDALSHRTQPKAVKMVYSLLLSNEAHRSDLT